MQGVDTFLVPFAAGSFIYIAATDLMPELHKRNQAKESNSAIVSLNGNWVNVNPEDSIGVGCDALSRI